jgi:predicted extracellular nuclease
MSQAATRLPDPPRPRRGLGSRLFAAAALLAPAFCLPAAAQLVINEIDYDQPGTDTAEFLELANVGSLSEDLSLYSLLFVNGAGGGAATYRTIPLPAVNLAPGGYFVVCANAATVANCDLDSSPNTDFIQNGAPDAVALLLGAAIVDTVSYEGDTGAPYTEGSGAGLEDDPAQADMGISRCPDGADTDQNNVDFSYRAITPGAANACAAPEAVVVINEIDYDQPGTDTAEFIELLNTGPVAADLSLFSLQLVNGAGGGAAVYATIALPAVSLAPGGYFVVCSNAATVADCDLDVSPNTDLIQNGAPDAVALFRGATLVDTVSYEGDTGAPFTEGSGAGLEDPGTTGNDDLGISRCPDGSDTDQNNLDFSLRAITPGAANACVEPPTGGDLVINEVDYDQPGTDTAEFIEIKNVGIDPADLSGFELRLVNGSGGAVYRTIALPAVSLAPGGYFVVCANAANTLGCDLDVTPDIDLVQNGSPDAVALFSGSTLIDTVSYEGDTVAPYTEGSGSGLEDPGTGGVGGPNDNKSISRFPDGVDTGVNNVDFSTRCATPGSANTSDSENCPSVGPPVLVINEIDYDQPSNDFAEFVEIKNAGTGPADLSGVDLLLVNGSGGAVYATIPLPAVTLAAGDYFVVCADSTTTLNCDLDVFPDTNLIQNGSPDAVALVLGGILLDAVSYEGDTAAPYTEGTGAGLEDSGSAGQDFRSIGRFPDGADSGQNNVDLINSCITPGRPNTSLAVGCTAAGPTLEIWEIEGSGLTSPYAGQTVVTLDNVVTAVAPDGFFAQTPDARSDGDVDTSDGVFVFTGGAPAVAEGDVVDVTGTASEFFDFTEISGFPDVTVVASGAPAPTAVVFDASVPSPDPTAPSCAVEFECYEGMLIDMPLGAVSGPNQRFSTDPIAEVHVVGGPQRAFREPGIQYPGLPGLPVWDGNPEVFELDPDRLGLPNQIIPAGSTFSARGVLGYEFGGYELFPSQITVNPATLPRPVRARDAGEYTVATLNMFRFFDDVDDPPGVRFDGVLRDDTVVSTAEYLRRRAKFASFILDVMHAPDVLAVEEVEKLEVLQDLAGDIAAIDPSVVYTAYLVEGNDIGTIDTGFLVRDTIQVDAVTQLDATQLFTFDGSPLHDRPPLLLEGSALGPGGASPIKVMAVHNRSLSGIDDPVDGPRVRQKRLEQAQSIAAEIQALQDADPAVRLVVIGDFNAYQFTDGYVDAVGQIKGDFNPADNLLSGPDLVDPNLTNQIDLLPAAEQYSFLFSGSAQVLDNALTSQGLAPFVHGAQYARGNSDAAVDLINDDTTPLRSSDHDGLVVYIEKDSDGDSVTDDLDVCPGTVIPEGVPTSGLNPNHYALVDGDGIFDTVTPPGGGAGDVFTIEDTGGCSCEQIIDALHLGQGHRKHGCSVGAMRNWVDMVNP